MGFLSLCGRDKGVDFIEYITNFTFKVADDEPGIQKPSSIHRSIDPSIGEGEKKTEEAAAVDQSEEEDDNTEEQRTERNRESRFFQNSIVSFNTNLVHVFDFECLM